MTNVLISDPNQRVALTVLRSLGHQGIQSSLVEKRKFRHPISASSRFSKEICWVQDYEKDLGLFLKMCERKKVFIPVSINTILFACAHADQIRERTKLFLPSEKTLRHANDKAWLMNFATEAGVPVPETWRPASIDDLEDIHQEFHYPCVVKLRNDEGLFLGPQDRYKIVNTEKELFEAYGLLHEIKSLPIVQEFALGESVGFSALYDEQSQMKACFCHRRIREYPISGGPSTLAESFFDENLVREGKKLLDALCWVGPAMVEFKRHPGTGELKLLEINPRFWGMLPLAIEAGVDFPHLLYRLACGENFDPVTKYQAGVKVRILFTDLLAVRGYLGKEKHKLQYLREILKEYLNPMIKDGLISWSDPAPIMTYILNKLLRRD